MDNLTRKEALQKIAELQKYVSSMTHSNHPPVLLEGMLFRLITDDVQEGRLFLYACGRAGSTGLISLSTGDRWADSSTFGDAGPEAFEYLGYAKDLLMLKPTVTRDVARNAFVNYQNGSGEPVDSMKSTLEALLEGKFN